MELSTLPCVEKKKKAKNTQFLKESCSKNNSKSANKYSISMECQGPRNGAFSGEGCRQLFAFLFYLLSFHFSFAFDLVSEGLISQEILEVKLTFLIFVLWANSFQLKSKELVDHQGMSLAYLAVVLLGYSQWMNSYSNHKKGQTFELEVQVLLDLTSLDRFS
mmetsp:Transcript_7029/g.9416  ORF Transcript_7029/g.9416 Transcript_7029/m.9416 type:complete len:162 (+) Transcript_7029:21-506(+)